MTKAMKANRNAERKGLWPGRRDGMVPFLFQVRAGKPEKNETDKTSIM
jgi:hypothetical protein